MQTTEPVLAQPVTVTTTKTARARVWTILPWVIFGVACVLFVIGLCVNYVPCLDADMSADLRLAKLLADGKGFIVTDQWYYSTELHFLHTQLIFVPLFWLFDNWMVVRVVGTIILNAIMLLSFYWLCKLVGDKMARAYPYMATLLIFPVGNIFAIYVNFGTQYLPYLIITFVTLCLVLVTLKQSLKIKRNLYLGLGAVLSLLSGIGGFRQLAVLYLPLFITAVVYWIINFSDVDTKKNAQQFLLIGAIDLGLALIGLLINGWLSTKLHFLTFEGLTWHTLSVDGIGYLINCCLKNFGYQSFEKVFGALVTNVISVLIFVLYMISVSFILKRHQDFSEQENIITLFSIIGMIVLSSIYLFLFNNGDEIQRYMLPVIVFAILVCAIYLLHEHQFSKFYHYLKIGVYGLILLSCSFCYVRFYLLHATFVFWNVDRNALHEVTNTLMERGYYQGYCGFNENILTEYSNGQIQTWCFGNWSNWEQNFNDLEHMEQWLQETNRLIKHPEGKIFMVFSEEELKTEIGKQVSERMSVLFENDVYYVYGFESYEQITQTIGVENA